MDNNDEEFTLSNAASRARALYNCPQQQKFFFTKIFIIATAYAFLLLNDYENISKPADVPQCINDHMFNWVAPINAFLQANWGYRNALIMMASLIMDTLFSMMCLRFILYHKNVRLLTTVLVFYIVRAIIQQLYTVTMPPSGYIWGSPGIFSIVVPYFATNDFFYSGHVGICFIAFLEFRKDGCQILKTLAFIGLWLEAFTLLVSRAHYSVDLIAGLIFAHYFYIVVGWLFPDAPAEIQSIVVKSDMEPNHEVRETNSVRASFLIRKNPEEESEHFLSATS